MAITCGRSGEILYVSHQDDAIDWEKAKEDGITPDSFRDNPTEEAISKLQARQGEVLTVFHLDLPHPNVMKNSQALPDGIPQAHFLTAKCLKRVDNLLDSNGSPVQMTHTRATRMLDDTSIAKIPAAIIWEIGFFLMVMSSGIEAPLPQS